MNRIMNIPSARLLLGGALLACSGQAMAAGFLLVEQNVREVGRAVAGAAAAADGPGSLYFNPASITYLEGTQAAAALHVVVPRAEFSGAATRNPLLGGGSLGTEPGENGGTPGLVPNFYYVRELSDRVKFGLGVNAPFGLVTEYDDGWVGRYHALTSDLLTVNINPALAIRLGDRVSLGVGVSAMYAKAKLSNAIDLSGVCLGSLGTATCASLGLATPGNPATDGKVVVEGDDWGFGVNLGLMIDLTDRTRLGFAYRSTVAQKVAGDADFMLPPAGLALTADPDGPGPAAGRFTDTGAVAAIDLPETVSAGLLHRVDERWTVMADVTWTNWSRFERLVIEFDNPAQPDVVQPENWNDSFRYSLGVEYRRDRHWTWRAGVAFDETPVPSAAERTPRLPGNDRTWLAFGFTWSAAANLSLDVAYAHLFIDDSPIDNVEVSTGHRLTGEFDSATDIVSAHLTWRF